jgi:branched-chain amino acid transport system substrate-binding protein
MKHLRYLTAALALTAGLSLPAQAAEPIKIGVLLPYSSVFAGIGKEITEAFELGLETFGNEINGRPIELIKEDTEVKPNVGLAKAKKLILQDEVVLIVGLVHSGVAGAVRDYVHNSKTPLVVANAGNDLLTGAKCSPWVIRASFSNSQINREMGPWVVKQGIKRVSLVAADYAAGHQMMEAFKASFTKAGGTIVSEQYPPLTTKDFGPYLAKLKADAPEAVYVFFAGGAALRFVPQYHDFGLKESIKLMGAGWLTSALYIAKQGDAAIGFTGSLNYIPSIDRPENVAFQKAFQAKYGRVASEFGVQGYDSARLIVQALKAVKGKTDDKKAIVDAMHKVSFIGARGPFRIDPMTNNVIQDMYVFETRKVGDKVEMVLIDNMKNVQDPPKGCKM